MALDRKYLGLFVIFTLSLGACSSSKTEENMTEDEAIPVADAGTDAMPSESPEQVATDPSIPEETAPAEQTAAASEAEPQPQADPYTAEQPAPVAENTDTATPNEGSTAATGGDFVDYRVQPGDTLMKIAFETYGNVYEWKKIRDANTGSISDFSSLVPGTVLRVERLAEPVHIDRNGEKYLIRTGDTLGTISNSVYGTATKWRKLWENNRQLIRDPNRIYAGFHLYYLPEAESSMKLGEGQPKSAPATLDSGWEQSTNTATPLAPEAQEESRNPSSN